MGALIPTCVLRTHSSKYVCARYNAEGLANPTMHASGSTSVIAQNPLQLGAKQNAKRLHGAPSNGQKWMNSPYFSFVRYPLLQMTKSKQFKTQSLWAQSLRDPFHAPPAHIPDFETNTSGTITSRMYFQHAPNAYSSTSASHNSGIVVFPNPRAHVVELEETVAGNAILSDLSSTGNAIYAAHDAVNLSGFGDACKLRMTACGVKITYAGTELNRSGEYISGNAQIEYPATGATGCSQLSPVSTLMGPNSSASWTSLTFRSTLKDYEESRINDATKEFFWLPNGVPGYFRSGSNVANLGPGNTTNGAAVLNSMFASTSGGGGPSYGENALVILISGDTTTSGPTGNTYDVEVITHWEVIPTNLYAVVYDVTPSLSNPAELSAAMNACSRSPSNMTPISMPSPSSYKKTAKPVKTQVYEFIERNQEPIYQVGTTLVKAAARAAQRRTGRVPTSKRIEL